MSRALAALLLAVFLALASPARAQMQVQLREPICDHLPFDPAAVRRLYQFMAAVQTISRVVDLLDGSHNVIHGMSVQEARAIVARGTPDEIHKIDGHFALVARNGITVRMVRTIGKLMRYFIAKRDSGPELIVSDRIDRIYEWLKSKGLGDSYDW